MIEDSLPYLVNYFGCINGSRNVYMNFALFFAYGACWYVKNGIKSFKSSVLPPPTYLHFVV